MAAPDERTLKEVLTRALTASPPAPPGVDRLDLEPLCPETARALDPEEQVDSRVLEEALVYLSERATQAPPPWVPPGVVPHG
jgi:hypothetical protein